MSSDIFKQSKVYGLIKIVHSEAVVNMDDNTNNMVSGTDTEGFVVYRSNCRMQHHSTPCKYRRFRRLKAFSSKIDA